MKRILIFIATLFLGFGMVYPIEAQDQDPVPPPVAEVKLLSRAKLDQLLGPIALYPDPLIAQLLPAATQPSEIVLADRFIRESGDTNQNVSKWKSRIVYKGDNQ